MRAPSLSPVQMAPMRCVPAKKARDSTKGRSPSGPHSSNPRLLQQWGWRAVEGLRRAVEGLRRTEEGLRRG